MWNRNRVLILEDDAAVADVIARCARRLAYDTKRSSDVSSFFADVRHWAPTHIVIDLVLPGADGVEVLTRLAGTGCDADVILTSGVGPRILECARRSAAAHGLRVRGVVPKPFRVHALIALLAAAPVPVGMRRRSQSPACAAAVTELEFGRALLRDEFVLEYQPRIRLATRETEGFEALLRWNHPCHGTLAPDAFIPALERSPQVDAVTLHVVEKALRWFKAVPWRESLSLSLNLSTRNLGHLAFADALGRLCAKHGVQPASIVLELTETSAMTDPGSGLAILTRLRLKGFQLSIDDFGTGYASMYRLAELPFSELKIDKSFVARMSESDEARKMVAMMIQLGRALNLVTVAEGVEDERTAALLHEAGCEFAQGFHFAVPMVGSLAIQHLEQCERDRRATLQRA